MSSSVTIIAGRITIRAAGVATASATAVAVSSVKTGAYTITPADRIILVDDTAGRVDLTCPALGNRQFMIQKVAGGTFGIRLLRTAAEKINGVAASYDLPGSTTAWASATPQAWMLYDNGVDRFVA